ncbi:MAG: uracil-DNA glycosylase [Oscillospiraceae bacterium]
MMNEQLWSNLLYKECKKEYFTHLMDFLRLEYKSNTIYPKKEDIFNALKYTPFNSVKVVILGQDPYPNENQAHGLSFSVNDGVKPPRSLQNIFKVIYQNDLEKLPIKNGNLEKWAKQGVLLLNCVLTVRAKETGSHQNIGWEKFTNEIIHLLNERNSPIVFLLWGNQAIKKAKLITNKSHLVLTSPHPSPLSASKGFFECDHFNKANEFLKQNSLTPIYWKI